VGTQFFWDVMPCGWINIRACTTFRRNVLPSSSSAEPNAKMYPALPCYFSLTFKSLKMKDHVPSKRREHVYSDTESRTERMWSTITSPLTPQDFLMSNFRRVLYAVCFLLGNSPSSVFRPRGITQKKTYNLKMGASLFLSAELYKWEYAISKGYHQIIIIIITIITNMSYGDLG